MTFIGYKDSKWQETFLTSAEIAGTKKLEKGGGGCRRSVYTTLH